VTAPRWSGAVLCGGASRRMGEDKSLLQVDGRAMAERVAAALTTAGADPVLAIGGDAAALGQLGLTVVPDDEVGSGPLGATRTALRTTPQSTVLVVACDLLTPSAAAMAATVDALVGAPGAHAAVPVVGGHHQWTHAAWSTSAADPLAACWADGIRSLRRAAPHLRLIEVRGLPPGATADADEPGDLTGPAPAPG
jgi:molybdopterin-guanine dinucleotide biosynthesis protein A